jgi:uncharacterized protein (UPF0261 family)
VPAQFRDRNLYVHNATVTLMRTTPEESAAIGRLLAERVSALDAPTAVLLPLRGISSIAVEGGVFHDPKADDALFSAIDGHLGRNVRLEEIDTDINDPAFAARAVELLNGLMEG